MRVHLHPADEGGCGHYRVIWPGEALQQFGYDVDIVLPADPRSSIGAQLDLVAGLATKRKHLHSLTAVPDCDVMVIQRPLERLQVEAIPHLQAAGVAVVVELDDDFSCIEPDNLAFWAANPKRSPERNFLHLQRACALADWVTVTTPALAERYARHGRVSVLPNCVPASYLAIQRNYAEPMRIGWSGSTDTHPNDLQVTRGAVAAAVAEVGGKFHVVGDGKLVGHNLGLPQVAHTGGFLHLSRYPEGMAMIDVGIVPLVDTAFNRAKSWLKGLEFAAVGTPFVATPTPEYVRLNGLGAGVLAARPRDWRSHLVRLATDRGFHAEQAAAGRRVAARHTVENNAGRWWDAWRQALEQRTRRAA
jgi:glycosyltransferase involved in cell wall biosynthesis